jgi:hypothetical protein
MTDNTQKAYEHLQNALDPEYPDPWLEVERASDLLHDELKNQ